MSLSFTWNLKELFHTQPNIDYTNFLDVSLAIYLENSDQIIDLDKVCCEKNIQETENQTKINALGNYYLEHFDSKTLHLWQFVESPLAIVLAKMEIAGVFIDKDTLSKIEVQMIAGASVLEGQILNSFQLPINLNSTKQLGEALVAKGFKLKASKASGNYSTNRNILESLAADDETGLINQILAYRTIAKLISTYTGNLIKLLDDKSRLHCKFNQMVAATGRLSSSDPNLQNIPIRNKEFGSQIRECFQASEGKILIMADYSQIELRFLAHFSGDENLIKAFEDDLDIHRQTAALMFEKPLSEVTPEERVFGKTLNFALVYQQGAYATARMLGITQKKALEFTDRYFQSFPAIKPFVNQTLEFARTNKYVESLLGRRRYFQNLTSPNFLLRQLDERAAFNAVLQGSNADLIKLAMVKLDSELSRQNLNAQIILQVHDELVLETIPEQAQRVQEVLLDSMATFDNVKLLVPIKVDLKVGKTWLKG